MADLVARKAGPVFAREVAAADPGRSVGTKASTSAGGAGRAADAIGRVDGVASSAAHHPLEEATNGGLVVHEEDRARAASDDGLGSVISPATRSMWG